MTGVALRGPPLQCNLRGVGGVRERQNSVGWPCSNVLAPGGRPRERRAEGPASEHPSHLLLILAIGVQLRSRLYHCIIGCFRHIVNKPLIHLSRGR